MENKFKFLVKMSFLRKIKNKSFIIGNIIVLIIIALLVNIDSVVSFFGGDFNDNYEIRVVDNANYYDDIKKDLSSINNSLDKEIKINKTDKKVKEEEKNLKSTKDILLVIDKDEINIFTAKIISYSYIDNLDYEYILSALNKSKVRIAVNELNLSDEDVNKLSSNVNTKRVILDNNSKGEEKSKTLLSFLSLVVVLPCFMLIIFLVQMIGAEINEEKQTRSMEIIIGNVSVKTHFFSKVVASNLFILLQGFLLLLYSFIGLVIRKGVTGSIKITNSVNSSLNIADVTSIFKDINLIDKLSYIIPLILILLVLSFLAYSLLAGILASMTTNMENFSQLQTPLVVINLIGYYLVILSSLFPGAFFIKVMSCIPLISISLAPSLLISGEISVNLIIVAILLLMLLDYLLVKYGLRIYKAGILNYSENNLWKKMFKAAKER